MKTLRKIVLNDSKSLDDSEMKCVRGGGNQVCDFHSQIGKCLQSECFVNGFPGRCQIAVVLEGHVPYASLDFKCVCEVGYSG